MDIVINHPIKIAIDTVGIDERLPSLELCIQVIIQKNGYVLKTISTTWFECSIFDSFIDALQSSKVVIFHDIDHEFILEIDTKNNKMSLISFKKDINGNLSKAESHEKIDLDNKNLILNSFKEYPKWW